MKTNTAHIGNEIIRNIWVKIQKFYLGIYNQKESDLTLKFIMYNIARSKIWKHIKLMKKYYLEPGGSYFGDTKVIKLIETVNNRNKK